MGKHPENYPEAIRQPQEPSTLPEVVPELDSTPQHVSDHDLSPQERHRLEAERDKYPAYYDTAPMFPYEAATPSPPLPEGHDLPLPYPKNTATAGFITSPGSAMPWDPILPAGNVQVDSGENEKSKEKSIFGLKKRTFIIAVAVAVAVILAAVIGGVVGGVTSKKSKDAASTNLPDNSGSNTSPTTLSSSPTSSAGGPTPTTIPLFNLSNETVPGGFAFQAYSETNFTGALSPVFRLERYYDIDFDAKSYIWLPNGMTECCVTFCANATTPTGWWCDERWRAEGSGIFRRVQIWCGRTDKEIADVKKKECSPPPAGGSVTGSGTSITSVAVARSTSG